MFNEQSKTSNVVRTSLWNGASKIVSIMTKFLVRTVFIMVLAKEYLGLEGLFTNVLGVMSLADLGIATAISVRFYEPIKNNDPYNVGRILNFYAWVYRRIALVITLLGLAFLPFVTYLLADKANLPADINIYQIYLLYLASTVASYLYSYRLALLSADQKNYVLAKLDIIFNIVSSLVQITILYFYRSYTWMLIWNTVAVIGWNFSISRWVTYLYPEVFVVKEMLNKEEQQAVWKDTRACLFHKFGGIVLLSTDGIVLTKMVSLAATGIYSNYAQVTAAIYNLIYNFFGNFVSSIGIARLDKSKEEYYGIYLKISFVNKWIAVMAASCTFLLLNDFIRLWIGQDYLLDNLTLVLISLNLYFGICRITNISFTNGCGWFVKDRYRPLIESVLNLLISIIATGYMGIAGVFLGTVVSYLLTVGWREPYILYRYEFERSFKDYWFHALKFFLIAVGFCCLAAYVKAFLGVAIIAGWLELLLEALILAFCLMFVLVLCLGRSAEFSFFVAFIKQKIYE